MSVSSRHSLAEVRYRPMLSHDMQSSNMPQMFFLCNYCLQSRWCIYRIRFFKEKVEISVSLLLLDWSNCAKFCRNFTRVLSIRYSCISQIHPLLILAQSGRRFNLVDIICLINQRCQAIFIKSCQHSGRFRESVSGHASPRANSEGLTTPFPSGWPTARQHSI